MHYASDLTVGYRHAIKDEIWTAYVAGFYPAVMTECGQEFAPPKQTESDERELCPICFPAEKKQRGISKQPTGKPLARSFIQLPVMVEAQQLVEREEGRVEALVEWGEANGVSMTYLGMRVGLRIVNRNGTLTAKEGEWIIKNTEGIFVPMRSDLFWASHAERDS